jgi:hypothetical protein
MKRMSIISLLMKIGQTLTQRLRILLRKLHNLLMMAIKNWQNYRSNMMAFSKKKINLNNSYSNLE